MFIGFSDPMASAGMALIVPRIIPKNLPFYTRLELPRCVGGVSLARTRIFKNVSLEEQMREFDAWKTRPLRADTWAPGTFTVKCVTSDVLLKTMSEMGLCTSRSEAIAMESGFFADADNLVKEELKKMEKFQYRSYALADFVSHETRPPPFGRGSRSQAGPSFLHTNANLPTCCDTFARP